MTTKMIQLGGTIVISMLICATFLICLLQAYRAQDMATVNLLVGAVIASFTTVVGYWLGSSMGSQRKSEMLSEQQLPPTPAPAPTTAPTHPTHSSSTPP